MVLGCGEDSTCWPLAGAHYLRTPVRHSVHDDTLDEHHSPLVTIVHNCVILPESTGQPGYVDLVAPMLAWLTVKWWRTARSDGEEFFPRR